MTTKIFRDRLRTGFGEHLFEMFDTKQRVVLAIFCLRLLLGTKMYFRSKMSDDYRIIVVIDCANVISYFCDCNLRQLDTKNAQTTMTRKKNNTSRVGCYEHSDHAQSFDGLKVFRSVH